MNGKVLIKRILALVLAASMLLLASCGNSSKDEQTADTGTETETTA